MPRNILLVEDNVAHQAIIKEHIEQGLSGIRVISVGNTTDAEAQLSQLPIDLIILDHGLPDKTGLDWYEDYISLQKDPLIRSVPILFVTVYGIRDEIKKMANNERNIIMVIKPFSKKDLLAAIKKLLNL